ncbi:hypothetical protein KAU11_12030 [Candidatus Babeliales bacterium]|nr:hypothetical protein [Candidatus Babeliales bacterium]
MAEQITQKGLASAPEKSLLIRKTANVGWSETLLCPTCHAKVLPRLHSKALLCSACGEELRW